MPSPRREELDERRLSRLTNNLVPIVRGKLNSGASGTSKEARKGEHARHFDLRREGTEIS
jgi:hypothetical protein